MSFHGKFVFQAYNLLPVLTALENAEFTLLLQGVPAQRRRERVQKLFLEIGLAGLENRRPAELSGGQQSREFEPTAQSIHNWVAQADRDAGTRR